MRIHTEFYSGAAVFYFLGFLVNCFRCKSNLVMKPKILLWPLLILFLLGQCSKEEHPTEVTFTIRISGFIIETDDFGGLKSASEDPFDGFTHKFAEGKISFTDSEGVVYTFGEGPIDGMPITLPVGEYTLTGEAGSPFDNGNHTLSFLIEEQQATISESTTLINITVTPTCALILVYDEFDLVASAYMNEPENSFYTDGLYYYIYFLPKEGWEAHILKTDGAELVLSVSTFLPVGHLVKVIVTESGTSMGVDLTPVFSESNPVSW